MKKLKPSHWRRSGVFIVDFEHVSNHFLLFLQQLWTDKCLLGLYLTLLHLLQIVEKNIRDLYELALRVLL